MESSYKTDVFQCPMNVTSSERKTPGGFKPGFGDHVPPKHAEQGREGGRASRDDMQGRKKSTAAPSPKSGRSKDDTVPPFCERNVAKDTTGSNLATKDQKTCKLGAKSAFFLLAQ